MKDKGPAPTVEQGGSTRDGFGLSWAAATVVGWVRPHNEDGYLCRPGILAVADGMGGHAAGEVASGLALVVCDEWSTTTPLALADVPRLIADANRRVVTEAATSGRSGMGTTLVGIAVIDNAGSESLVVFHVGDSRCYAVSSEGVELVTSDHSVIQELIDQGTLSREDASTHPERHVITRAIGIDLIAVGDYLVLPTGRHRRLLLCSDGLSGQLTDEGLAALLIGADSPSHAVAALLDGVLEGPAPDNATAVVVDIDWHLGAARVDLPDDVDVTGPRPTPPPELISQVPIGHRAAGPEVPSGAAITDVPV